MDKGFGLITEVQVNGKYFIIPVPFKLQNIVVCLYVLNRMAALEIFHGRLCFAESDKILVKGQQARHAIGIPL